MTGSAKDIAKHLESIKQRGIMHAKAHQARPLVEQLRSSTQLDLPWFDDAGLQSSPLVSCSLFTARSGRVKRVYRKDDVIEMPKPYMATIRGEELRQDEASILACLVNLTKNQSLNDEYGFKPGYLLAKLNWSDGKKSYAHLFDSLTRLRGTLVTVINTEEGSDPPLFETKTLLADFSGGLGKDDLWVVRLDEKLSCLYSRDKVTVFDWNMRITISATGSNVALWLFSYLSEFSTPRGMPIEFLLRRSGLDDLSLSAGTQNIKRGCQILVKCEFLKSFSIKNGVLFVSLMPSRIKKSSWNQLYRAHGIRDSGFSED